MKKKNKNNTFLSKSFGKTKSKAITIVIHLMLELSGVWLLKSYTPVRKQALLHNSATQTSQEILNFG